MTAAPPQEASTLLAQLRDALRGAGTERTSIDSVLDGMQESLTALTREHAGMADELLRVYEQIGIVFDITRKLPSADDELAVVRLFVECLKVTYHNYTVRLAKPDSDGRLRWPFTDEPPHAVVTGAAIEAAAERRVVVNESDPETCGIAQILAAPVLVGDELDSIVVLVSKPQARPFDSSDMSLMETLTVYLADLLRNYRLVDELRNLSYNMVKALVSAVDQKDAYTSGHSNRVGHYATLLGREIGLKDEELQMLEWSALLHDVGKIGIRDEVLKKPGKLTKEEFDHIKEHPVRSYEVVRQVPQLTRALDGVRHHHERYDGSGYPDGLAGENIPLQARIIQVVDIFDALTTSRSYRKAFDWEKALRILKEETGTVGDPRLVPVFDALIRRMIANGELSFTNAGPNPHVERPQDRPDARDLVE